MKSGDLVYLFSNGTDNNAAVVHSGYDFKLTDPFEVTCYPHVNGIPFHSTQNLVPANTPAVFVNEIAGWLVVLTSTIGLCVVAKAQTFQHPQSPLRLKRSLVISSGFIIAGTCPLRRRFGTGMIGL